MATINLTNGEDFIMLEYNGNAFLKEGTFPPGTSYSYAGLSVVPSTIHIVESDGNQQITVDTGFIVDNFGNEYFLIVGGRPQYRVRPK